MPFAYSKNGISFRTVENGWALDAGEVYFATQPTSAELASAFSGYGAAVNEQEAQSAFSAAVAAGVQITSTGTPALNGTYALDDTAQGKITSEQVYIATKGAFTNGQSTRAWPDASGAMHTFPSTAEFTDFAETVAQYYDALLNALDTAVTGGTAWVAPSMPAAIA